MINTLKIYEELAQTMEDAAARRLASVLGMIYEDLQNTVTKVEFNELRGTVRELAEAQQRTEQRMGDLVEAQQQPVYSLTQLSRTHDMSKYPLAEPGVYLFN